MRVFLLLAAAAALCACESTPQIYSNPKHETLRLGLADTYRRMYHDYRDTGVFEADIMRRVAQAAGARVFFQAKNLVQRLP